MPDLLPMYLTDQTEEAIRQRILDRFSSTLDKSQGSALYNLAAAMAIEMVLGAGWAQEVLNRGFAQTTFGAYLANRAEEHGVIRKAAVKAVGIATFTGLAGTVIPAGTRISTGSTQTQAAIVFITDKAATIATGQTTVDAAIAAEEAGAAGNVVAGAVSFLSAPINGISAVSNASATTGGMDEESDEDLLSRYLTKVRNPSAGGNKADYINWALEVSGVGSVAVVPVRDGAGTVSIAIINTNKAPGDQTLVDAVQDYVAPPWENTKEAENMTLGGFGTSIDGTAVKMAYDAGGNGTLYHSDLKTLLQQPGIWQARVSIKADANTGTSDLLQIGVWSVSANAWAKISPSSAIDAVQTLQAVDLAIAYADMIQSFYWNGTDQLELRIIRLTTDTVTTVWVDKSLYRSTFSQDTGTGKAPIGARVSVEPAGSIAINVSATLTIASGYDAVSVKADTEQAIGDYLKSLAFKDNNDVLYVQVGNAILNTAGVQDYSALTVNGGTANITVGDQQVAVKGTVSFT